MDNIEAINRLSFIRCALLGVTKPQINPNETNVELFDKAIEAIEMQEALKKCISGCSIDMMKVSEVLEKYFMK